MLGRGSGVPPRYVSALLACYVIKGLLGINTRILLASAFYCLQKPRKMTNNMPEAFSATRPAGERHSRKCAFCSKDRDGEKGAPRILKIISSILHNKICADVGRNSQVFLATIFSLNTLAYVTAFRVDLLWYSRALFHK